MKPFLVSISSHSFSPLCSLYIPLIPPFQQLCVVVALSFYSSVSPPYNVSSIRERSELIHACVSTFTVEAGT